MADEDGDKRSLERRKWIGQGGRSVVRTDSIRIPPQRRGGP